MKIAFCLMLAFVALTSGFTANAAVLALQPNGSYVTKTTLAAVNTSADCIGKPVLATTSQSVSTAISWTAGPLILTSGSYITFTGSGAITGLKEIHADFGDGTDKTAAMNGLAQLALAGTKVYMAKGNYLTSTPWSFTRPVSIQAGKDTRISLTASAPYIVSMDFTGGYGLDGNNTVLESLILDGQGFATDGLVLNSVYTGKFDKIRVTNVIAAGLHMKLAQSCLFTDFTVSGNVETFITTPVEGILADTSTSSDNTFINPIIEHVSGSGVRGLTLSASTFINGTSEGNNIGIELGASGSPAGSVGGNTFIGMDLEANTASDVAINISSYLNDFYNLAGGYMSGPVNIVGSRFNTFHGGTISGYVLDATCASNKFRDVTLLASGSSTPTLTHGGAQNIRTGMNNAYGDTVIPDIVLRARTNYDVAAAGSATIDVSIASYATVTANGATLTINAPINMSDGQDLDIEVINASGGATAVTWAAAFKMPTWVNPANGNCRSIRFRYNGVYGTWKAIAMIAADVPRY